MSGGTDVQALLGGETVDLTLETRHDDRHTFIAVGGEIDVYTAPGSATRSPSWWARALRHRIDMERVDFLDSTGLGVLVGGLKKVRAHSGSLRADLQPGAAAQDLPDHRSGQGLHHPRVRRRGRRRLKDGIRVAPAPRVGPLRFLGSGPRHA